PESPAPVIFLHGLGADSSSWTFQFEPLHAKGFRPIAVDIPGFGKSRYPEYGWTFRKIAGQIVNFSKKIGLNSFHLAGLSMGGVIAQQLTLDNPDLVKKLVLASTFSSLRPASLSQLFYFIQRALVVHLVGLEAQSRIVARRVFPDPGQESLRQIAEEQIRSADPRAYRAAMRSLALFNSEKRLKEISSPTLVIAGENDSTVQPYRQKLLADKIKSARYRLIKSAGHAVSIDQYRLFNETILEFLSE
ncbi:MAG: alpha/beta hydrolase, partial [Chloroflexota bacterium]